MGISCRFASCSLNASAQRISCVIGHQCFGGSTEGTNVRLLWRRGRNLGFGIRRRSGERKYSYSIPTRSRAGGERGDTDRGDDGALEDAGRYLENLSLEYDSVWDTKPAWCQPWTIVGTGSAIIGLSWLALHNPFITGFSSVAISAWWFIFLYAYPIEYSQMIAKRRKNMQEGQEDTFGTRRVKK